MLKNVLSQLFVARTRDEASRATRGSRAASRKRRATSCHFLAGEWLERRSMLAVTASVVSGILQVSCDANGDQVNLEVLDAGVYEVRDANSLLLRTRENVTSVSVVGDSQRINQSFTLGGSVPLEAGLTVSWMNTATINAQISNTSTVFNNTANIVVGNGSIGCNGRLYFGGDVTLATSSTISARGSRGLPAVLEFGGTVNGAHNLTVNASDHASSSFQQAVGTTNALASLIVNGPTTLTGDVTTVGSQTYTGAVTLTQDVTLGSSGSGAITFSGAVDGPRSLTVNTSGITTFSGTVGGVTSLTQLITDFGGTVSLQSVTTSDGQDYNDNATLNGTYSSTLGRFLVGGTATLAGNTDITVGSSGMIDF